MGHKRQQYGKWVYPHIGAALAMVGLEDIRVYIERHNNMVAQYIATRPTMDLCLEAERKPVRCLSRRWCENTGVDILDIRVGDAAAEGGA